MDYSYTIQMASSLKDYFHMPFFPKRITQHRVANVCALRVKNSVLITRDEEYGDAPQPGHVEWRHEIDGVGITRRYMPSAAHQHAVCKRWHRGSAKEMWKLGMGWQRSSSDETTG
jgi:hypothetical protein